MNSRIPDVLVPLLQDYLAQVAQKLPGLLDAFYIEGSIALDAFNPTLSDVDFVAVVSHPCTKADLASLSEIHQHIAAQYPRWQMQGAYLQWSDLGAFKPAIQPAPNYSDGVLHPTGHGDGNSITWWTLKHRGIALLGREPDTLDYTVDMPLLLKRMMQNMNTFWRSYLTKPSRIAWLWSDFGIEWMVLGTLRQYYTFREQAITSKVGAGEYALKHLPQQWHQLIQEAINIRNQPGKSLYRVRLWRAMEAYRFLRYIISVTNSEFGSS
jgi:hypothetical protein